MFSQMRLKRVIKKIAALSAGATMVGATVLGAMAADLGDYPSPLFIKDGKFSGILVVGDKADAKDIIGITDVMGSLQYAATKSTGTSGTTTASISDGVKIDKSSSHLNYNTGLWSVQATALGDDDLPVVLADGTLDESEGTNKNDVNYEQEIKFVNVTSTTLVFHQDDDDAPTAGNYLLLDDDTGEYAYVYELEFDEDVDYDNTSSASTAADFNTAVLEIQGNTYTITDVKLTSAGGNIDKVYMQAGETSVWLDEGTTLMRTIGDVEHEIVLVDVQDIAEGDCGISVDGVTQWVGVGSSKTINGVDVGVTKSLTVHSATQDTDTCQVNLGAQELLLEKDDEIQLAGSDIDGSYVQFKDNGKLQGFNITYIPEDETYVAEGAKWTDPVLGNIEYHFAGITKTTEDIELKASGKDATLTFMNNDNKEVEINWRYNGSAIVLGDGDDIDDLLYVADSSVCTGTSSVKDCKGVKVLKVTSSGEAHVIEINDIDVGSSSVQSDGKITLRDKTYDDAEKTTDYTNGTQVAADLPAGAGILTLTIDETLKTLTFSTDINEYAGNYGMLVTGQEAEINISTPGGADTKGYTVNIYEDGKSGLANDDDSTNNQQITIAVNLTYDGTDKEIDVGAPVFLAAGAGAASTNVYGAFDLSDSNDDDQVYMTFFGTYIKHDLENKRKLEIAYPYEEAIGNVFISKVGADVTTTTASGESVVIQRISVGATKLASEVSDVKAQDAILVGGPCANAAAADAMGNPADCAAGFEEGKGLIQLVEHSNGKVAMIVAGYSADDTRNAATVVANYADYALSGAKMEVSKVGASITVASATE